MKPRKGSNHGLDRGSKARQWLSHCASGLAARIIRQSHTAKRPPKGFVRFPFTMNGSESLSQSLIVMKLKNVQPVADLKGFRQIMSKIIGLLLLLAMVIQIIKPLGFPGLKRRADFWKLAVVAFVSWAITLLLRDFI